MYEFIVTFLNSNIFKRQPSRQVYIDTLPLEQQFVTFIVILVLSPSYSIFISSLVALSCSTIPGIAFQACHNIESGGGRILGTFKQAKYFSSSL